MKPTIQQSLIKVAERMSVAPTMVNPADALIAAKALMEAEGFRHLPVVDAAGSSGSSQRAMSSGTRVLSSGPR
jgi:CBS domain-containing protein